MPMNKKDYNENWDEISFRIRTVRAKNKCERRGIANGAINRRGSRVVLTVHHKNHDRKDDRDENLECLCQGEHLADHRKTRLEKSGKRLLPFGKKGEEA